jgi:LPXTG-motif cell wall-anchored protein
VVYTAESGIEMAPSVSENEDPMRMFRKFLLLTSLMAALMLGSATLAQAQTYGGGTIVAPPAPAPGGTMQISGTGFPPNTPITVTVGGTTITGIVTDASGSWVATVPVPTTPGVYTITATDGTTTSSTTVTVGGSSSGGGGTILPNTGSSSPMKLAPIGAGLIVVGALIVFGVRSRNRRETKTDSLV